MPSKWSYSSLMAYETCPYRIALREAGAALPPEDPNSPLVRGSNIHKKAEDHVRGGTNETPEELEQFKFKFYDLQDAYKRGDVKLEEPWYFDANWQPCDKDNAWLTTILDVFFDYGDNSCKIIDHKTGRKLGNEIKHAMQGQLYTAAAFNAYPEMELCRFSFWYLDHGQTLDREIRKQAAKSIQEMYTKRAEKMLNDQELKPTPSKSACKWCDYAKSKACDYRCE